MDNGPLMNDMIPFDEVRVTGMDKEPLGIMNTDDALDMADELDVDLVIITEDASPPVARLIDYSKFKFEKEKADRAAKKKSKEMQFKLKEVKFRVKTEKHDYDVRLRRAQKFLLAGDKVKVSMQYRGREMEFKDLGMKVFENFIEDLGELAVVDQRPAYQGRQLIMTLAGNRDLVAKAREERRNAAENSGKEDDDDDSSSEEEVEADDDSSSSSEVEAEVGSA